ncbi:helix-turn-helix domain-containing protein [Nocardia sp. IFM 10818]
MTWPPVATFPRTVARRFTDQLGTSPGAWLLPRRTAAARILREDTGLTVEAIATRVGLVSAVNLRRRVRTQVGATPGACRRAFPHVRFRSANAVSAALPR